MLPFTSEQFLAVFGNYNIAILPAQIAICSADPWLRCSFSKHEKQTA